MDELRWDERPGDLRSPVMVAAFGGWNDAAAAASNAVVFVGERLGARRVASIDPEAFYDFQATRPLVDLTSEEGLSTIEWPEVEVLVARVPDGHRDVVLVAGAEPSMRWRTFCRLLLGCCVLKIGSERGFRQWYYDDLVPWRHYVPVAADVSDLSEKIDWCRSHPDACETIADEGRTLALSMTFEREMARGVDAINRAFGEGGSVPYSAA